MVHCYFLLAHWLSLLYTIIFNWPSDSPHGTLPSFSGQLALPTVHYHLLLPHWPSLWYSQYLLQAHWLSLWYTTICPFAVSVVHCYLLFAHWPSLCYSTIFYWPTGSLYGTLPSSNSPVAPSCVTLPFSTGPLAVSMIHYYLLLANWLSLWYTTIFSWPTGYLYGTQLSSTGRLTLPRVLYNLLQAFLMVHYHLLLVHWLNL